MSKLCCGGMPGSDDGRSRSGVKPKPPPSLAEPLIQQSNAPHKTVRVDTEKQSPKGSDDIPMSPKLMRKDKTMSQCQLMQSERVDRSHKYLQTVKTASKMRWLIIIVTAVLSSTVSFAIDEFTQNFGIFRTWLSQSMPITMLLVNVSAVVAATLLARTQPKAQGSGFPEMKAILFGAKKNFFEIFTIPILFVKGTVLALVVGAGLPLGKEGPNVHMAGCLSRWLAPQYYEGSTWTVNRKDRNGPHAKVVYLLMSCCAVGVGSSFSAPIAGVVFSIELMLPQIIDSVAYWGCFVSSVTGAFMYSLWRTAFSGGLVLEPLMSTDVEPGAGATTSRPVTRFLVDIVLGCLCGLLSGYWVRLQAFLAGRMGYYRNMKVPTTDRKKYPNMDIWQVVIVTIVNTTMCLHLPLLGVKSQPVLMSDLFSAKLMDDQSWIYEGTTAFTTMFLCLLVKTGVTLIAMTLPVATGVVAPVMIIGALVGRCYGLLFPIELLNFLLSTPGNESEVTEAERHALMARFAIVGAAAFSTGVCRAFAMAITVYEVLCLPNTLLPLCSSCLVAGFVANLIAHPFFDNNLVSRGLGGIVKLTYSDHTDQAAANVMRELPDDSYCLHEFPSLEDIDKLLNKKYSDQLPEPGNFAIIRNLDNEEKADKSSIHSILVGSVSIDALKGIKKSLEDANFDRKKEFNLLDAKYCLVGTNNPHISLNPANCHPDTVARDVYIMMKANDTDVVYVCDNSHHCRGIIEQRILLGHDL